MKISFFLCVFLFPMFLFGQRHTIRKDVDKEIFDENVPDITMIDQQGKKVEVKFDTLTTDRKYYVAGNSVTIFPGKTPLYFDAQNKSISEEAFVDSINNTGRYVFSVRDTTEHSLWTLTKRERPPQKVLGKKLPYATLTDLQGNMHAVGHDTCGVTLVAFWSVTCPPCIEELTVLNIVKKEFPGVAFVAVTQDKRQTVLDFMSRRNLKWNNLTLVTDYKGEFDIIVRPRSYPFTMIADNSNVVQYVKTGKSLRETLLALDRLLTTK